MPSKNLWSSSAGRFLNVPIRYHFFLVAFCILIFAVELNASGAGYLVSSGTALATVCLLLASVLLHEMAHALAVKDVGGVVEEVVLTPWGGLSEFTLPNSNSKQAFVAFAGPLANGLIFLLGAYLLIVSGNATVWQLINPMRPFEFDHAESLVSGIRILTWLNFQLFILNLVPCFPFDGGNMLRCLIISVSGGSSRSRLESAVMVFGQGFAFALIGLSVFVKDLSWGYQNAGWVVVLIAGIALIYSTRYSFHQNVDLEEESLKENEELEHYFEDRPTTTGHPNFDYSDDSANSIYSNWLREKEEERLLLQARSEASDHERMDSILEKLHNSGIQNLKPEEKEILDRVSARLRKQRQQGVN
jgi:Zn-dependent protease